MVGSAAPGDSAGAGAGAVAGGSAGGGGGGVVAPAAFLGWLTRRYNPQDVYYTIPGTGPCKL